MLGVFLDTETNGLNFFHHSVLEIAFKIVDLLSLNVIVSYESTLYQTPEAWAKSDAQSLIINGFTYDVVSRGKCKNTVCLEILKIFEDNLIIRDKAVFICQNPSFDRAFFSSLIDPDLQEKLKLPYYWLDLASMYWVEALRRGQKDARYFPWETGFSKDNIAQIYHLPSEKKPHRAMNGVDHLLLCYRQMINFKSHPFS